MTDIRHSITIAAPPERVWQVMIDIDRFPEWFPRLKEVRNPRGEVGRPGSTYEAIYELPTGQEVEARSEIVEAVPGQLIVERFEMGDSVTGEGRWELSRQEGEDSTHVDMRATIEVPNGLLSDLATPIVTAAVEHEVANVMQRFKEACEGHAVRR